MSRLKDEHEGHNHKYETLDPDLKGFYDELHKEFPNAIITGGSRSANSGIGNLAGKSRHVVKEGMKGSEAMDIRSNPAIMNFLKNDIRGLNLLTQFGVGLLDEGDHGHIGKDSKLVAGAIARQKELTANQPITTEPIKIPIGQTAEGETKYVSQDEFRAEVDRLKQKEIDTEKKKLEDQAYSEIELKKQEKEAFINDMITSNEQEKQLREQETEAANQQRLEAAQNNTQSFRFQAQDNIQYQPLRSFSELNPQTVEEFKNGGEKGDPPPVKWKIVDGESSYYDPLTDMVYLTKEAAKDPVTISHELAHKWQRDNGLMRSDPYTPKATPVIPNSDEVVYDFYNRRGNEYDIFTENVQDLFPNLTGNIWTPDMNFMSTDKKNSIAESLMYNDPETVEGEAEYLAQIYGNPPGLDLEKIDSSTK